ncbi:plastidial pyruvate kinase 4, chloroplastic-like isoform X2 [Actinidia eriantha]|uniref:plastidial pyruvate kinase 4, chloroplastic-like isoform X2 n=1 Tax=Actinidia eriantha TaxID=165200 RepID=UPI00258CEA75|nr:plastidial pyruvate kinase 4, chloroplastic-like isoform X2 [Actinidia eriantha]XP_057480146.1 plastidial pyruvate kinase 4, chloroplastic-like isoform X2 [Actinidia eriantha]
MMMGASLICTAIQTVNPTDLISNNFWGKFTHLPCGVHFKKPVFRDKTVQLLARQKRNPGYRTIVFSILNENGEAGGFSHACADDSMRTASEDNENVMDSQDEVVAVLSQSGSGFYQNAVDMGNQGNLLDKLKAIQLHVLAMEQWNASRIKLCHRRYSVSAANLIHHLALKSLDVEQLREDLSSIGLVNLETINSYVLASLSASTQMLENLKSNSLNNSGCMSEEIYTEKSLDKQKREEFTINIMSKKTSLNQALLLGPLQDGRTTHIMVTVGHEVLESEILVTDLLKTGVTIIRINCAHGNPSIWSEIIRRVKTSSQMLEKPCRILMDLAGPKLRTGKLETGPCVMKISPKKNASGEVICPAQVWLCPKEAGPLPGNLSPDAVVYVKGQEFLSKLELGDTVKFSDARGQKRQLKISKKFPVFSGIGFMAECSKTAYVQSGTALYVKGKKGKSTAGLVVDVPAAEQFVRLRVGDLLTISRNSSDDKHESTTATNGAHRITCSSGYLFDSVKPGDPIAFDDGKIWGTIHGTSISEIVVSITHAGQKGTKLGSDKSINIPESNIRFDGLTSKDLMDLNFVAAHADMVGVSFVRDVRDIVVLRQELEKRKLGNLGIVLKIETKGGFEKLPLMLLEAMKSPNPLGVMIARGDLAVECGWERLADIQEEILSISCAAHIPVIWATQVLESLVKSGVPTRAEITDVACGRRASCIMLNKGKHILEAVSMMDTILHGNPGKVKAEVKPLLLSSLR